MKKFLLLKITFMIYLFWKNIDFIFIFKFLFIEIYFKYILLLRIINSIYLKR